MLMKQDDKELPVRNDSILPTIMNRKAKKLNPAERATVIKRTEQDLDVLQPTPLKPIKSVELWKKWGSLLPKYTRLITYPKPSNGIIDSIKEINRNKTWENTKRKRGIETGTSNTTLLVNDTDNIIAVKTSNTTAIVNDEEAVISENI